MPPLGLVIRRSALLPLAVGLVLAGCLGRAPGYAPPDRGGPPPRAPAYDPAVLERLVHAAANEARRRNGLEPLRIDAALTRSARRHSADLARTGAFSHTGTDGSTGADRAEAAGVRYRAFGENLYRSTLYASGYRTQGPDGVVREHFDWTPSEALAREAVAAWLASPGHRANLLGTGFGRAGVGVALADGAWTVTMDYAD